MNRPRQTEQFEPRQRGLALGEDVSLREFMELRVKLAELETSSVESRCEIKFAQVAHDAEITRLLNEAKFEEHNTALEQMGKLASAAALAQKDQAAEFSRKAEVGAELRSQAKQIEDLKLARSEGTGIGKGGEPLRNIGMLVIAAIVSLMISGVGGALLALVLSGKLGG